MTNIVKPGTVNFEASITKPDMIEERIKKNSEPVQCNVSEEAINAFCNIVGSSYSIAQPQQRFFGFMFTMKIENSVRHSFTAAEFTQEDIEEALRVTVGQNYKSSGLLDLVYSQGKANLAFFPEYNTILQQLQSNSPPNSFVHHINSPYIMLMRIAPFGRAFFAGALYEKVKHQPPQNRGVVTSVIPWPINTKDILEYAKKVQVTDIRPYMKLIANM